MSIRLLLDDSFIQVVPALDDVESVLIVQTRYGTADGKVRKVTNQQGRRVTALPRIEAKGIIETRIGANDAKGHPEYETRTVCRAGGTGSVFLGSNRKVRFSMGWYGENRYLELRLHVSPGAEIVANRGMGPFGQEGGFNFLGTLQTTQWAEIHYDNLTHVGLSMAIHELGANFSRWETPSSPPKPAVIRTRFDRIGEDD